MNKTFVSNSSQSTRMFNTDLLESLSKVHFSIPLIVYIPVIGWFIYQAFADAHNTVITFLELTFAGLLFWSLIEYVLHRFIFHYEPTSAWGQKMHFIFHGVHHDYPNDAMRLVMPPSVSIPLALIFYSLFTWALPAEYVPAFFAAFLTGYLFYDISHYAIHHGNFKSRFWKKLKQHHMLHHYTDSTKGFGVSSFLWDKVFGSDFEKK
jgi:sterol desaturase/sphingolipid hydroxylase (fatty acid hydroxylase superfamily)